MQNSFFLLALLHAILGNAMADREDKAIVGGEEAEKGRYSYQVALMSRYGLVCGGSLVDKDWVLSAAHCKGVARKVRIGSHDLSDNNEDFEEIEIDWETAHPDYCSRKTDNDYMMVKLKQSSTYGAVTLDDGSANFEDGTDVTVMGWGTTSSGGSLSNVLLEAQTDIVSNANCNSDYSGKITSNMVCAAREGIDSCQGDSGGPLIIKGNDASADVQVGIVSWGSGCANPNYPGVYARVSEKYDWIQGQISSGVRSTSQGDDEISSKLFKFLSYVEHSHLRH